MQSVLCHFCVHCGDTVGGYSILEVLNWNLPGFLNVKYVSKGFLIGYILDKLATVSAATPLCYLSKLRNSIAEEERSDDGRKEENEGLGSSTTGNSRFSQ